jgi:hypothetical protein
MRQLTLKANQALETNADSASLRRHRSALRWSTHAIFYCHQCVALAAIWLVWTWRIIKRSTSSVKEWAAEGGYKLMSCEFALGLPLQAALLSLWRTSLGGVYCAVRLRDSKGLRREASVRCGRFVGGVFSCEKIEVTWSDKSAA